MQQAFLDHIKRRKLCTSSDKILLATSGGIDSMVLMDLFLKSGFTISVAHVNFKLRGAESDKDEHFVREKCAIQAVPFFTKSFDTSAFAEEKKLSIQMAARELRYQWFMELATQHGFAWIATAHHLNDSIETALLNLARGSGLEGWDGIESKNENVIRPLLFASREQIENYAADNQITWREDKSNASDDYKRNFVRHQVVPLLHELNSSFENSFVDSMNKIAAANELANAGLEAWKNKFIKEARGVYHIAKTGLDSSLHPEGILWYAIKTFGFNLDQCKQIFNSLHGQPGKIFYSSDYELTIDRSDLILTSKQNVFKEILIEEGQTEARLGPIVLSMDILNSVSISSDPAIVLIDADKVKFPLVWRGWKEGDFFHPLGMQHKKKVSDFLIDQKVSLYEKKIVSILFSRDEVIWVVGLRLDDRFKITTSTKNILKISATQVNNRH